MCFFPFLAFSQLPLMDLSSNPENIKKFRLFFLELSKDHRKFSVISCVNTRDHRKFSVISCLLQEKHSLNFLIFSVLLDRSIEGNCLFATEVHNFLQTRIYQYNSTKQNVEPKYDSRVGNLEIFGYKIFFCHRPYYCICTVLLIWEHS